MKRLNLRRSEKIAVAAGVIVIVGLLVGLNPFGISCANPAPGANITPGDSEGNGGGGESGGDEGEVTNPGEGVLIATFGISPGKFYLHDGQRTFVVDPTSGPEYTYTETGDGAYIAGTSREYQLTITNKNDHEAEFSVDYRVPDNVVRYRTPLGGTESYSRPTPEVRDWVWISDKHCIIPAHGTATVSIRLGMPESGTAPGVNWEFWIAIMDKSQTGNLLVEQVTRWLVAMA